MVGDIIELMDLWRRQAAFAGGFAALGPSAGFVIATRLTQMATTAGAPDLAGAREAERMLSEKVSAAVEGSFAATRALAGLVGTTNPVHAGHVMVTAGEAALKPAARRLKANARRLSRG